MGAVECAVRAKVPDVLATSHNASVSLKLKTYLGKGEGWEKYASAIRGTVFDPATKTNLCPRHAWPKVAGALLEAGFTILPDAKGEEWIAVEAVRANVLTDAARERLKTFKKGLQERGLTLRAYQEAGVLWLANRRAGLLLDEQGTGKTIQTLCAIPEGVGVLIFCPASLRGQWRDEILRWRPDLTPTVVVGDALCRWPEPNEVLISSDSGVRKFVSLRPWPARPSVYTVVDECHLYKGRSLRTDAMQILLAEVRRNDGWTIGLTGTPLMNHPSELFTLTLLFGCMRLAFGSWSKYTESWNCRKGRFSETVWGKPKAEVRQNLSRVSLRRTRAEVMPELPPKVYTTHPVDIKKRLQDALDKVSGVLSPQLDAWATMEKLPSFEKHSEIWTLLTKAKIDDMLDWCDRMEQAEEPVLVFSMHLEPLSRLKDRPGWAVITGDTPPEKRTGIVKAFQGGDLKGVGLSIKAAGVGLTLTQAAFQLFVDRSYNPMDNVQAEDRSSRYGQTRTVHITSLVADHPLDRRIHEILTDKSCMIQEVL
jgi:SWI/SNF-related matrix-associated actin-dependent regulator of chromatin subfamily A-like protein 1